MIPFKHSLVALGLILMTSCAVVSKYDQNSYESAQTLKVESLALVSHSAEPVTSFQPQIDTLKVKLTAQLAYEQGKGKGNVISAKQWEILISKDHELLGKLLEEWETGIPHSQGYITEKSLQIGEAFNEILRLEAAKTE